MKIKINKIIISLFLIIFIGSAILAPLNYLPSVNTDIGTAYAEEHEGGGASDTDSDQTERGETNDRCGLTNMGACVQAAFESVAMAIGSFLLLIAGWILGLSGLLLTESLNFTVIGMSDRINDLPALNDAWGAFRDLANIFFIFLILYIAIATILRLDNVNTKKLLVQLVIVALLLNFSLFFTKVLIDASNILAIRFHQVIADAGGGNGIAGAFMQKLGMQSFADPVGAAKVISEINGPINILLVGILSSVLFLVVAFVFGAMAIMLIARFIILIFLMILSPLAFISMALPNRKLFQKWSEKLISQLLFAPAMLAFIWVTLIVLGGLLQGNGTAGGSLAMLIPQEGAAPGFWNGKIIIILNFMIIMGMAIFSLLAAKELGAYGAERAISTGKRWARNGGKAIGFGTGYLARRALNSEGLAESKEYRVGKYSFKRPGFKIPGGGVRRMYEKSQQSEFWNHPIRHRIKEATLGRAMNAKIAGRSAVESYEEGERLRNLREDIGNKDKMVKEAQKLSENDLTPEKIEKIADKKEREAKQKERLASMGKISENAAKISASNFEGLFPKELIGDENIVRNLPDTHYDALMKGSVLNDKEKDRLTEARIGWIQRAFVKAKKDSDEYKAGVENGSIDPDKTEEPKMTESLKNEIKNKIKYNTSEKEFEHIYQHKPEMFDSVDFVKKIPTSMIKKLRVNPAFGVGKGEELRAMKFHDLAQKVKEEESAKDDTDLAKVEDFYKEYYKKNSDKQLKDLRDGAKNSLWDYSPEEIADAPTELWKKPAVMSGFDEKTVQEWSKKDIGERRMLVLNALMAEKIGRETGRDLLTPDTKHLLDWMRFDRNRGRGFFNLEGLQNEMKYKAPEEPHTEAYKKARGSGKQTPHTEAYKKARGSGDKYSTANPESETQGRPRKKVVNEAERRQNKPRVQMNLEPKPEPEPEEEPPQNE